MLACETDEDDLECELDPVMNQRYCGVKTTQCLLELNPFPESHHNCAEDPPAESGSCHEPRLLWGPCLLELDPFHEAHDCSDDPPAVNTVW